MTGTVNVAKAVDYLRGIGVDVPDETAAAWEAQQRAHRLQRRRHRAEIKRGTCGHFRTSWCRIASSEGTVWGRSCSECRKYIEWRDTPPPRGWLTAGLASIIATKGGADAE